MTIIQSTLRPGLLVALSTKVVGNVVYRKNEIEPDHLEPDGTKKAVWETERRIEDPAEHEEATKVRGKCRSLITSVCSRSSFGLLCPEDKSDKLSEAVRQAQELANEFNLRAQLTQIGVYIIAGRVAQDDVSAVRAINSEVRDLLTTMEEGLARLDVQTVRDAANRAKEIGAMLSPDAAARIQGAIDVARSAARKIVKAAEEGVAEIDMATLAKIRQSRAGFLDLEDTPAEVAVPETHGRAIDLPPEEEDPTPIVKPDALAELLEPDDDEAQEPSTIPAAFALPAEVEAIVRQDGNDHPTLCQCAECEALYGNLGEAINQPSPAVRRIELTDD